MVRLEDGWIYVTLEHSCPVERRSGAMFIIYDVLHCCIIYHWACFAAVLHWFACLQSLGSVRSLDKQKRLREMPIIDIFEKSGTCRPCYWSRSTTFHKIPLSIKTCRSRVDVIIDLVLYSTIIKSVFLSHTEMFKMHEVNKPFIIVVLLKNCVH